MPVRKVHSFDDIQEIQEQVRNSARVAREKLRQLQECPMEALYDLKFTEYGSHYLKRDATLNLVEQLNQSFTIMVTLAAAKKLFRWFPELKAKGLKLNLGPTGGWDIASIGSNHTRAEVFAAVRPENNDKLREDLQKFKGPTVQNCQNCFVFFHCPNLRPGQQHCLEKKYLDLGVISKPKVQIWALGKEDVL